MKIEEQKRDAAEKAVEKIQDGMVVGLGTGSTVKFALIKLAEKISNGELKNIQCVSSSNQTEELAKELSIPIISLNELYGSKSVDRSDKNFQLIDLYIDGADEVDKEKNLIKGGGGALLREKILAQASKKFIVIVDESKLSEKLGMNFYLPVEVFKFSINSEKMFFNSLGFSSKQRMKNQNEAFITDEGNFILDVKVNPIDNPKELSQLLDSRAGIVGHGIFLKEMVGELIVGRK